MTWSSRFLSLLLIALVSSAASAAVYLVPPDREMVQHADAIVLGTVIDVFSHRTLDGRIVTTSLISPEEVLKGPVNPNHTLTIIEPGGAVDGEATIVSGIPLYWKGERALVFLQKQEGNWWVTWGMSLGRFTWAVDMNGRALMLRTVGQTEIYGWDTEGNRHRERPRLAEEFLAFVRASARGLNASADYFLEGDSSGFRPRPVRSGVGPSGKITATSHFPASAYTMSNFRWAVFDQGGSVGYRTSGVQVGYDGTGTAQRALAAWTNEPNSNVNLQLAGTTTAGFVKDNQNTIFYNAASGVPAGAIAYAQLYSAGSHVYKGESFNSIVEGDVIVRSGLAISASAFDEAVAHEVGHTLGFRHSNEGTPASSNAVMNAVVTGAHGANLAAWDVEAVTHVYGSGAVAPPPPPPPPPTGGTGSGVEGDFNHDRNPDLVWRNYASGANAIWLMQNSQVIGSAQLPPLADTNWRIEGVADFSSDGGMDLLWRNSLTGENRVWILNGTSFAYGAILPTVADQNWRIEGVGDFNADGRNDLVWRHYSTGRNVVWYLNGMNFIGSGEFNSLPDLSWHIQGVGDFNGDGRNDLVWRNYTTGANSLWLLNGTTYIGGVSLPTLPDSNWRIQAVADYSGDGRPDLVWRNLSNGGNGIWVMSGTAFASSVGLPSVTPVSWEFGGPR